jgi:hypothetical protein
MMTSTSGAGAPSQTETMTPVPRPRSPLVGRNASSPRRKSYLERADVGLLTLSGAGGSGKTRLALSFAGRQHGYFADGVAWVPLAFLTRLTTCSLRR